MFQNLPQDRLEQFVTNEGTFINKYASKHEQPTHKNSCALWELWFLHIKQYFSKCDANILVYSLAWCLKGMRFVGLQSVPQQHCEAVEDVGRAREGLRPMHVWNVLNYRKGFGWNVSPVR